MQEWLHITVASVTWGVAVSKSIALWRRREWFRDKRVYTSWGFIVFFTLSVTFNLETFYLPFDAWAWGNNLSWLLCNASVTVAMHLVVAGSLSSLEFPPRLLLRLGSTILLFIVLMILGTTFLTGIAFSPEYANRSIPRTLSDLAFIGTMDIYVSTMCLVAAYVFAVHLRAEAGRLARFRWSLLLTSLLTVTAFLLTGVVLACLSYLALWPRFLRPLLVLLRILEGTACLLWPTGFLPSEVYVAVFNLVTLARNLAAAKDLLEVQGEFERQCPEVSHNLSGLWLFSSKSFWWYLRRTDLRLYQLVVSIYDDTRRLARYLRSEKLSARLEDVDGTRSLCQLLEEASKETDYVDLIQAYRKAARMLRAERKAKAGNIAAECKLQEGNL